MPRDAAALSLGAEAVARAIADEAARRGIDVPIVRNGSRGLFWLEPLVEVDTATRASRTVRSARATCRRSSMRVS